jgi:uncharacterized protein (DUF1330 family)
MSRAIVVGRARVKNQGKWALYRAGVGKTLKRFHADVIFRGKRSDCESDDIVVIRFPDIGAAHEWHQSVQYQGLIPLRDEAATVTLEFFQDTP